MRVQYLSDPEATLSLALFIRLGRNEADTRPVQEGGGLRAQGIGGWSPVHAQGHARALNRKGLPQRTAVQRACHAQVLTQVGNQCGPGLACGNGPASSRSTGGRMSRAATELDGIRRTDKDYSWGAVGSRGAHVQNSGPVRLGWGSGTLGLRGSSG